MFSVIYLSKIPVLFLFECRHKLQEKEEKNEGDEWKGCGYIYNDVDRLQQIIRSNLQFDHKDQKNANVLLRLSLSRCCTNFGATWFQTIDYMLYEIQS